MGETAEQLAALARLVMPVAVTEPPSWVLALVDGEPEDWVEQGRGLALRRFDSEQLSLVSARVRGAVALGPDQLEELTRVAYGLIGTRLQRGNGAHAARIWNFIPGILAPLGELPHRYMAFNAGRYAAFEGWYEARDRFDRTVPTASGVGHDGEDLVIHCLAAASPGTPVENPRQVPSYRYSKKYGPLPPCFARATLLELPAGRGCSLLVGGTASVRGEQSVHPADLEAQAAETFENLAALVAAGLAARAGGAATATPRQVLLVRFRSLRVYYKREQDRERVSDLVAAAVPRVEEVELLHADLCRAPLLVEIEGVAALD